MLRAEVGMRVRCANKASAEWFGRERGIGQLPRKISKKRGICGCCALSRTIKRKAREQRSSWHAEHEVHSAEVKVCLSARKAPIVLPLSHKRLWRGRNSFLVRGVAVNRKAPPSKMQTNLWDYYQLYLHSLLLAHSTLQEHRSIEHRSWTRDDWPGHAHTCLIEPDTTHSCNTWCTGWMTSH